MRIPLPHEVKSPEDFIRQVRGCDGCNVCCVAPPINATALGADVRKLLPKKTGAACVHCSAAGGCSIYKRRPEVCASYKCAYILGWSNHHPKETGVAYSLDASQGVLVLIGHCLSAEQAFDDPRVKEDIIGGINHPMIEGAVLHGPDRAFFFIKEEGIILRADIDPSDELGAKFINHQPAGVLE